MARLLACWELGLGLGHLAALAPAARALAAMGHESWLAARDVVAVRALADAPFARVLGAPIWRGPPLAAPALSYGQVIADGGFADDDGLIEIVRAWLVLFELVRPAAVYGDHAPAALLAAHVAGLPAARLGTPFTCPPAARPMAVIAASPAAGPAVNHADAIPDRVIRGVCRHFGAAVLDGVADMLATAPPFLTSWPEADPAGERRDSAYYGPLTGFAAAAAPDWPLAPGPRVFVYLPFDRASAPPLAAALGARGWPVIWVCAAAPAFALPGNIRREAEPIDIGRALREATLFAGRGAHGSSLDAIRAGCPQLLAPDTLESRTTALAIAARGLGRLVPAWDSTAFGACLDALAAADAPEHAACAEAAARHADYDAIAASRRLGHDLAAALRLD